MANYLNQISAIKSELQHLLILVSNVKRPIKWLEAFETSSNNNRAAATAAAAAGQQEEEQQERLFISLQYIQEMIDLFEQTRVQLKIIETNLMKDQAKASADLTATKRTCERDKKKRMLTMTNFWKKSSSSLPQPLMTPIGQPDVYGIVYLE